MSTPNKRYKEDFARFFESPSREGWRDLLQGQLGELDAVDFKQNWPSASKLARHVIGLANTRGGCLIAGIAEKDDKSFEPVGLASFMDKADIQKSVKKYLPVQLKYEIFDFAYEDSEYPKLIGKKFQVLMVEDKPQYIPFIARCDGDGIRENALYVRRGTNTEEANYEELQEILNHRIETGYSSRGEFDLNRHLSELNSLYRHIAATVDPSGEWEYYTSSGCRCGAKPAIFQRKLRVVRQKVDSREKTTYSENDTRQNPVAKIRIHSAPRQTTLSSAWVFAKHPGKGREVHPYSN